MSDAQRYLIPSLVPVYEAAAPFAFAALRVIVGLPLIPHGYGKVVGVYNSGLESLAGYADTVGEIGLPFPMAWVVTLVLLETLGAVSLALGFLTRPIAVAIVVFMIIAGTQVNNETYWWWMGGYEMPLMWGSLALILVFVGGGKYSLDRKLGWEF